MRGAHLEAALDLRLQVRLPADRRLRGSEGRPLVAVRKHPRAVRRVGSLFGSVVVSSCRVLR